MRLAILIFGVQNSGKTSTFKKIVHNYNGKQISQMRMGWQRIFLTPSFKYLKLDAYFLPSSPTEKRTLIKELLPSQNWIPNVLFIAEQLNGSNLQNTLNFLNKNNFNILQYTLSNQVEQGAWDRYDSSTENTKLSARADEIIMDIKSFISSNGII